jgi:voltage-gated potassium channel
MPAIRRLRLALLGLASVVGIGVAGYVILEHWNAFDALYMTIITMATIGYGEVKPLTQAGRAFTIFLILAGAASVTYTAAVYVELLVGDLFKSVVEQRRMNRELDKIRDHYLVCGYGRMGQEIVEQFARRNIPFVIVELSEEKCRRLADLGRLYVCGDASDDEILKKAGHPASQRADLRGASRCGQRFRHLERPRVEPEPLHRRPVHLRR